MTAQETLRAALEKHGGNITDWPNRDVEATLEAMAQHRAEALEELPTDEHIRDWANSFDDEKMTASEANIAVHARCEGARWIKAKLAALKTSHGGSLRESEG